MTDASRTVYDLTEFDRARLYIKEEIPAAAGFAFTNLRPFSATRDPDGIRSFSRMLADIVHTPQPPKSLTLTTGQLVVVASHGQESIGLSIIDPADSIAFDTLTWINPQWRHRGLATAMKIRAIHDAQQARISALWAPSDSGARSFYEALGLRT